MTEDNGGEKGLEPILGLLEKQGGFARTRERWCVEFGAGRDNNNTANLIDNQGWHGVLIEANPVFFADLSAKYRYNNRVVCLEKRVQCTGIDTLDSIFKTTNIPRDFELLIIDIDGNDYSVWDSLSEYQPRVVMIEYNGRVPAGIEFAQPANPALSWGSSLEAITKLGQKKGYELVYAHICNAIFVKKELFPLFKIRDNRPEIIEQKFWPETRWFQLYDGTIILHGCERRRMLNFKKKISQRPIYLLTAEGLLPVTFRRDWRPLRVVKNFAKKTYLYRKCYPLISRWYGRSWHRRREKL